MTTSLSTAATEPEALPTFESLPLSRETLEALTAMGYTHPTPVQRAVFEPASRGLDLVVQARTGTGKTAAFGLPIIESVVRKNTAKVQVLALCPTRELALQVCAELERLGRFRDIKPIAIYGGAPMPRQVEALASGAQVVVGTPGRVLDHLQRGTLDPSEVRMLVLDEADEMLSMGFERELSSILERLPKGRQTLLFSATIPPDIERIARDRLRAPEFITLSGDHIGALEIQHFVYFVRGDKLSALTQIIEVENPESAIVFCNTKADTERVAEALERQGFNAAWLNGDLPQGEREQVMKRTREGKLRFLVATDVAARGIDISHLTHVINFDFPESTERYVHRTGRTGRAGRTGQAVALITAKDIGNLYLLRLTYKIKPIEKQLPTAGELKTREEADVVLMLAEAFGETPAHPDDLALARRLLSHESALTILAGLVRDHLGARPEAVEQAGAARRSKTVALPAEPEPEPSATRSAPAGRAPSGPRAAHVRPRDNELRRRPEPATRLDAAVSLPTITAEIAAARSLPAASDEAVARAPLAASDDAVARAPQTTSDGAADAAADVSSVQITDGSSAPRRARRERTPRREGNDDELRVTWVEEPQFAAHDATFAEIFVSLGRRDGISASDFQRVLTEAADIARADTGRIRIRDRSSFVSVKREALDKAVAALNGASIGGKVAQAEPARSRSAGTSSPNDG